MPSIALAGTGATGAMLAAAARSLGWNLVAVSASTPQFVEDGITAPVVPLDELIAAVPDPIPADVVVVDSPVGRRAADAVAVLARGVGVVLAPGLGLDALTAVAEAVSTATAALVVGDPFPTAPAVQRWFADLGRLGDVGHLSARAASAAPDATAGVHLDWPLLTVTVLSARVAGWGAPLDAAPDGDGAVVRFASGRSARVQVGPPPSGRPPHWELQAASDTGVLRVEMLPRPAIERDGQPVALAPEPDPAVRFGAAPLLRTFRADVIAGRPPVLGADFAVSIERLRLALPPRP